MEPAKRDREAPDRGALDSLTEDQHGVFTRTQASACGFTNHQITRRIREGDWVVVRRGVLAERGRPLTPKLHDIAALLLKPEAVLGGPSAARWHDIEVPSDATYLVVEHRRARPGDGSGLHMDRLPPEDICPMGRFRITTLERTIFDCVRVLPDPAAEDLLSVALEKGWTTLSGFGDRVSSFSSRHGAPRLVRLLQNASTDNHAVSKRMATKLLHLAGLWGWKANQPIEDRWGLVCIGDIVFAGPRLLLDLSAGDDPTRDDNRHNRLLIEGWTIIRLTWVDLAERPGETVADIRMTLASLGAHAR